ncbi:Hypothetical protein MSYG_1403 [Malassezia sympodialis ATCC 42132]|uniref:Uncharacterized protein n=1 Tax=Malassezia sympodialis (strain ATCC 42132) TaxID=1230383 RepID=A0A1M8A3N5_MALS4|nr:Hypothetical protein MSYG_1403 [Malassezia sympodialis ATCC 42132]
MSNATDPTALGMSAIERLGIKPLRSGSTVVSGNEQP